MADELVEFPETSVGLHVTIFMECFFMLSSNSLRSYDIDPFAASESVSMLASLGIVLMVLMATATRARLNLTTGDIGC